jgi:uncharacterized protein involved in outer membrane biogenesis
VPSHAVGTILRAVAISPAGQMTRHAIALSAASQPAIEVRRVMIKQAKLSVPDVDVPKLDADLLLAPDGTFRGGDLKLSDGTLAAEFTRSDENVVVTVKGRNWKPSYGPEIVFDEFTAKGAVTGNSIRLDAMDAQLYGGSAKGSASLEWNTAWTLRGEFALQRVQIFSFMEGVTRDARVSGELEAKVKFAMSSPDFSRLYSAPQVQSSFALQKGTLDGVDMVRALQTPKAEGVFGGKTRFDDLTGNLAVSGGRYQYRDLRMKSGVMVATGTFDIGPDQDVGGRILLQLDGPANPIRSGYSVAGKLKSVALKP